MYRDKETNTSKIRKRVRDKHNGVPRACVQPGVKTERICGRQ